jgi:ribulose-bisphosphate carboxylase large chain
MTKRIHCTYLIESPIDIRKAAELLASEQTIGSFTRVLGETDDIIDRFGGRVEALKIIGKDIEFSLPTSLPIKDVSRQATQAVATISFPAENFAPSLSSLVAILLGNLFELQELTGVRLLDIDLPSEFLRAFPSSAFGVEGTRQLAGVTAGPIIGTIVKPKLGLSAIEIAELVRTLGSAGIHFIKDDECMTNPPSAPFAARVKSISAVLNDVESETGRRPMYAFNISDDGDTMCRNHDVVAAAGGTCVMISINACGPSAVAQLRRNSSIPIHAHRAGWGMFTRHPSLGISFRAYQKLWRLAGIDQIHIGGVQSKFFESDESVIESARDCLAPLGDLRAIMPVISSGQWGGQAPATYKGMQSDDVIYLAGGGILGHPMGPAAGVAAISQAWEAARKGIPLEEYALSNEPLAASIKVFGNLRETRANQNA